ncbi:MAG TPA: DUF4127 family protein [Candidatus Obscuribacterales bacterium]
MADWLFLPLDGRPCNARFPVELAALAGQALASPPTEQLGNARQSARRDRLQAWLESRLEGAQGLMLSLDTWIYGNLVASRKNREGLEQLRARIGLLADYRARGLAIHGFATLLRLSNSNDDTEERPYWALHGQQIYRYSWLEHYLRENQDAELEAEFASLEAAIPTEALADYRQLRARNFAILQELLTAVEQELLQTLLIGCDDGGSHGWTVLERQHLQAEIEARGLGQHVLLYPGADELACTLLARVLAPQPLRLQLAWTHPEANAQITRYEGIPLAETLAHQARAAGVELADPDETGEGLLWIHNPPGEQIDQFLDREHRVAFAAAHTEALLAALRQNGIPVALADVVYANGGDIELLECLERERQLFGLSAYAGWNTAGNTLGMLLAWFKLCLLRLRDPAAQQRFLVERLADDGWYQGWLRQQLCAHYSEPVTIDSCIQAIAFYNEKFRAWSQWMPDPPPVLQIQHLSFPWRRFFEVDLRVCTTEVACEPRQNSQR